VGHFTMDVVWQSSSVAKGKNRHRQGNEVPPGQTPTAVWPYYMTGHALSHGGVVALATGSILLGTCEVIFHWGIDFAKCENWTNPHQDQALHIFCKIIWALYMVL